MIYKYKDVEFNLDDIRLSYSSTKHLIESVQNFFEYKTKAFTETDDTLFGQLYHCLILEPETFPKKFFVMPEQPDFPKKTKEQPLTIAAQKQEWLEDMLLKSNGRKMIKKEAYDKAETMVQAFFKHPLARTLLHTEHNLYEQQYKFDIDGIKYRAFLDLVNVEKGFIVDLKTIVSADMDKIEYAIKDYKYYLQEYLYSAAASIEHKRPFIFHFIFQEKTEPYDVQIINLNESWQDLASEKLDDAVKRWKAFKENPATAFIGRHAGITTLKCPVYLSKKFKNRSEKE